MWPLDRLWSCEPSVAQGLHCRADLGGPSWVKPRTLIDLGAKLTINQEQLDAAVKQHADGKSVFGVNFQDVSESVDAMQRAIVVVSARSDANGMALLQRQSKTETAMHRVKVALPKEQRWRKKVAELIPNFPLKFLPSRTLLPSKPTRTMTSDLPGRGHACC